MNIDGLFAGDVAIDQRWAQQVAQSLEMVDVIV